MTDCCLKDAEERETESAETQSPVSESQGPEQRQKTIQEYRALWGEVNGSANARAGLIRSCAKAFNVSEAEASVWLNGANHE